MEQIRLKAFLVALAVVVLLSRVPLYPGQLFSFDDVNLAYAAGEMDVRKSQPHPPGYPLFVLQMRALRLLRIVNPASALQVLSIAGTIAAALAMVFGMRGFAGVTAAGCAAALLVFHPANWYASLTSSLRAQLALVSISAAAACWRAWQGDRRWAWRSALILAIGAGIRPDAGLVLLPLWLVSVSRGAPVWRDRLGALVILTGGVLAWLLPLAAASGGLTEYLRVSWHYLKDQAALTSGLFGASGVLWARTAVWLFVWAFCGAVSWPVLWRNGTGLSRNQWLFLAVWTLPGILFALFVHVADPGQTLAIVPASCLLSGALASKASFTVLPLSLQLSWLAVFFATGLAVGSKFVLFELPAAILILAAAGAVVFLLRQRSPGSWAAPAAALTPELVLYVLIFWARLPLGSPPAPSHVASGLYAMTLSQIRATLAIDDRLLREISAKAQAGQPAYVLWDRSDVAWRKVAFYLPTTTVVVLDRASLAGDQRPVATAWRGPHVQWQLRGEGVVRLRLKPGSRLVWALKSGVAAETLPNSSGSRAYGPYQLEW